MLAIIDKRAPQAAIRELRKYVDDVLCFESTGITCNSISGHPDIFIYQDSSGLIVAPNAPGILFDFLESNDISFSTGSAPVGSSLEKSVLYNCVGTEKYFIHKSGFTDTSVLDVNRHKKFISIPQAYTRCSLISLDDENYITSDMGIVEKLEVLGVQYFNFSPEKIKILDHKHGFVGGTCGLSGSRLFFIGNIDLHEDGRDLRDYLDQRKIEVVTLCDEYLYDGGGLFFTGKPASLRGSK